MQDPYENQMSIEQLRREIRQLWDEENAFRDDICDMPEIPSLETMRFLRSAGMGIRVPDVWSIGKRIQRDHAFGVVPPKTEDECAVGLWAIIRGALLAARKASSTDTKEG